MIMGCQRAVGLEQIGQSVIWPHPFRSTVCAVVGHAFSADHLLPGETLSPLKVVSHTLVVVGAMGCNSPRLNKALPRGQETGSDVRKIRAVVYGIGTMGTIATRLLVEKGVDIVGAIARSPDKVCRDLGELAGIAPMNVPVSDDAERMLRELGPDVVLLEAECARSSAWSHDHGHWPPGHLLDSAHLHADRCIASDRLRSRSH
jgi:Dihydrodipicolinate reductase, N-terminus